jgi:hypothetical protein
MSIKVQELSDKVLLVTFPEGGSEDSRQLLGDELKHHGFKVIWLVG